MASPFSALHQVWHRRRFRRLLVVKLIAQTADGTVQVGVASYTLLSPERAPDAWAIAGVLAITMLPFSILGPFVSVFIDRWDRRRTVIISDLLRFSLTIILALLVLASGYASEALETAVLAAILIFALVVMSLERFQIATLLSGLPHTIDDQEYLAANTVLPVVGPLGVVIGAAIGATIRLTIGIFVSPTVADTLIFLVAALLFALSVLLMRGFAPHSLGPTTKITHRVGETLQAMGAAVAHVRQRTPALLGILTLFVQRCCFGVLTVIVILLYRNHFHDVDEVDEAVADVAIWAAVTAAGFILASLVAPQLVRRLSLRWMIVAVLGLSALVQVFPGSILRSWTLLTASFLIGLLAQSLKMSCETLVQAHVDDSFKGRVLVLYDIAYNTPLPLAGFLVALFVPDNGWSPPALWLCAAVYAGSAISFALVSHHLGPERFARGTESVTGSG